MSYINKNAIQFSDSASIDPFGRARVSTPYTIFDSKQLYDNSPLFWNDVESSGTGTSSTFNTNQASSTLAVSLNTLGTRIRQTKRRFNYQPGKGHLMFITFVLGATVANVNKRVGYFDDNNGIYLQLDGTGLSINRRTYTSGSPVEESVIHENWNLDSMDGNGPSGVNIDSSKAQILMIDMEWLGVGRVRCAFVINGIPYYFHEFVHANLISLVYMNIPNLPIRYEISNNGSGGAASMDAICSAVLSEGGVQENGFSFSVDRDVTPFATGNNTSAYPIVGIRLASTKLGATVRLHSFSIITSTATTFRWAIYLNPTIAGTALSYSAVANSTVEASTTSTNATTVTGGTVIYSGYSNQSTTGDLNMLVPIPIYLGATVAGVADELVLVVNRIGTGAESFLGALNWIESV